MTPAFETIHILVVDDEASIRRLAEKELSSERRLIATAGSAQKAFKAFKTPSLRRCPVGYAIAGWRWSRLADAISGASA
jgi:DNA-binding NtrC family response regulator